MHNWANFCDIIKFNLSNKNLVAVVAARFFLNEDACKMLKGMQFFLVPPELDLERNYIIDKAKFIKDNTFEFSLKNIGDNGQKLVGKSMLISNEKAQELLSINEADNNILGKIIIDKNFGEIGKVADLAGASEQKHLVVNAENKEILIPYVDELIESQDNEKIIMNLPKGLLDINKE